MMPYSGVVTLFVVLVSLFHQSCKYGNMVESLTLYTHNSLLNKESRNKGCSELLVGF